MMKQNEIPLIVPFGGSATYNPVPLPRDTLGGKGCGLVTMSMLGLNVPPGFTITTGSFQSILRWKINLLLILKLYISLHMQSSHVQNLR